MTAAVALLLLATAFSASAQNSPAARPATAQPQAQFPLETGTYWIYQGTVTWAANNSAESQETTLDWKMAVGQAFRRTDSLGAVVTGFPRDLDWSQGDTKPAKSLIIRKGSKYYWIPPTAFASALARLENPNDSLEGLVNDDELFLDLPLSPGKKFCDSTGMIRTDGFYCWVTGEPEAADLAGVKGVLPGDRSAFPVQFLTMPDSTEFVFVPGIGITSYSYQHHGTAADTELQLAEFHSAAH